MTTTFTGPIVSSGGFQGNVTGGVTGDVVGAIQVPTYTVSSAPSASGIAGTVIYVSNGAAGNPILAFSNGTDWKRSDTGATIAVV